jgi:hypothetical protein
VLAAALLARLLLTGLLALLAGLLLAALLLLAGLLLAALLLTALLTALLSAALPTLIGIVHDRSCSEVAPQRRENGRSDGWFPPERFYLTVQQGK